MNSKDFFSARVTKTLSPMDYLQLSKLNPNQAILVDVRNAPAHFKKVKIENAIEIPQNELEARISELPKDKTIVVYCWDTWCNLAAKAALVLIENGYVVKELSGGIAAWNIMKLPVINLVTYQVLSNSDL
jgi:rhodanese-related sulfurtransferase